MSAVVHGGYVDDARDQASLRQPKQYPETIEGLIGMDKAHAHGNDTYITNS